MEEEDAEEMMKTPSVKIYFYIFWNAKTVVNVVYTSGLYHVNYFAKY